MDNSDLEYSVQMMLEDPDAFQDRSRLRCDLPYYGFDNSCGQNWIYPTNYPKRDYQYAISKKALFQNTLVVLPTGLGKTFIAAVVMYNFYRWYPKSKVIFMAPARPLVAQQINACYDIMGISQEDTVEITGRKSKKHRQEFWKSKRVFYATPQAVLSDMLSPEHNFPVNDIRLVVIDEAHKAKGKYAYTEVINYISERNKTFRVLALSATPGRDLKDVREIAQNLLISHIEVRYETSFDVAPFTFKKLIKTEVVPFDNRIKRIRSTMLDIMEPYVEMLKESNVLRGNTGTHSKGWIIMQQNEFRRLASVERPPNYSDLASSFSTCVSLYHSLEVLERHGCRMFLNSFLDEENRTGYKYFVNQNHHLKELLEELRQEMGVTSIALDRSLNQSVTENPNFDYGHPKFRVLQEKLLTHFTEDPDSKVIVFCELRETVLLIDILLSQHKPLIRPRKMVGQGSSSGIKAVTQKEQLAVMEEFKKGLSNCLIATCVVEEGIDVGDVMMIVCFDSNTNPTRYVQRIGRTGRKQQGKVLMLVAEGREHENLKNVLKGKDKTTQKLSNKKETEWFLYKNSPRLIPPEFDPECLEVCFDIKAKETLTNAESSHKTKKKETKTNNKPKKLAAKKTPALGRDMRNFFKPLDTSMTLDDIPPTTKSPPNMGSRTLPRPKPPLPSTSFIENNENNLQNSTHIDFTLDQNVIEEPNESDHGWEMLQQMRKKRLKTPRILKKLDYPTDKEILDCPKISADLKKFLLSRENNKKTSNQVIIETERNLRNILEETKEDFDPKRLESLLNCVKKVENLLKNEIITEVSECLDQALKNLSASFVESEFNLPLPSQPSRYAKKVDSPLLTAFDRARTKVAAESTPIRKSVTPSASRIVKSQKKINEQEVLNSLGLKSIDDLFGDFDFDDDPKDDQNEDPNRPTKSLEDLKPITNDSGLKSAIPSIKRPCDAISSPLSSKNKRQMLEFVDLDNILGGSDDDLFGDFDVEEKESPKTVLEHSLSKLNSSLSEFLADELLLMEENHPKENHPKSPPKISKIQESTSTTPKSTKQVLVRPKILITEVSGQKPVLSTCKTPPLSLNTTHVFNETSPSLFRNRYSCTQSNKSLNEPVNLANVASPLTQVIKPVLVRNKRQRKILSDSEDDLLDEVVEQPIKKQKTSKKSRKKTHCAFLDNEAGVSGDDSDDFDGDMTGFSELQGFVVDNDDETLNDTMAPNMFAKYVESTRSPHGRNRFKIPQQLRPFNPAEIYSQAVPIEASQYDLNDSFVVDEEVDEESHEMSELEIAEARIEAARKERKRNRKLMLS